MSIYGNETTNHHQKQNIDHHSYHMHLQ